MRKLFAISILLFVSLHAQAQTSRLLTTKDGLCSTSLSTLCIDSDGNLWIGTQSGLNKYDGFAVSSYYCRQDNSNSLTNDVIQVLKEDNKRNLIIGTLNGLCTYSLDDRIFRKVIFNSGEAPNVSSIIVRSDGTILAGTHGYAGLYDVHKNDDGLFIATPVHWTDESGLSSISTLYEDSSGTIWLWADESGLYTIDKNRNSEKVLAMPEGSGSFSVTNICEDPLGSIYLTGMDGGVLIRRKGEKRFTQLLPDEYAKNRILNICYHDGYMYMSTMGQGLLRCNLEDEKVSPYFVNSGEINISRDRISSMVFDRSDNLLLAISHKGVLINTAGNDFLTDVILSENEDDIPTGSTTYMSQNAEGQTWVCTDTNGAFLLDSHFRTIRHICPGENIACLLEDRTGTIWYSISRQGLYRILPGKNNAEKFNILDDQGKEVRAVNEIIADLRNNLWIASSGVGIFTINQDRTECTMLPISNGRPTTDGLCNKWINCLELVRGRLYIGTYNGLACYDFRTNSFLGNFGDYNHIFEGLVINDIQLDANENIWLASTTGLVVYNAETKESRKYTYSDGLPQNNILAVESDSNNHIWISTPNGLACLTPENDQFTRILSALPGSNEFCKNVSSEIESEGVMMFGNLSGLSWFNPNRMTYPSTLSKIQVSGVYIGDRFRPMESFKNGVISLKHSENVFNVELTTGVIPENRSASFLYKIDGGSYEHLPRGTNRIAFNKMKSGRHVMKVACNSPLKKYEELELNINVHRPWYASTLALLLYLLLASGIAALTAIYQHKKYARREEEQKDRHELDMNEAKLQYFFNLAHEIRMPMSLIISPLNKLIATDKEASRQIQYKMMANNARRITLLINQIMDIRKIEKGKFALFFSKTDINQYVKPLIEIMDQNAMLKSISLSFSPAEDNPEVWIDVHQFDKIILNLIQNAIKFTPEGGRISVNLGTSADSLVLSVQDNGIGIDDDHLDKIFERFYQVNKDDAANMGVGIGLNLVQSLVAMHHGTVRAFNNVNGPGATFEVKIPLGRKHLNDSEITAQDVIIEPAKSTLDLYGSYDDTSAAPEESGKSKLRSSVAVVEDSKEIRQYLVNELSADYNVTAYENGEDAFNGILKSSPDIIISDIIMPKMDGFQLCEKIKRNVNTNAIPVILLTGKNEEIDKITGMDVGADAYITKPFSIILLKKNIEQLLDSVNRLRNIYIGRQEVKIDNVPDIKDPDEQLMARINKVLNDNISNPELNVDFLAREACLSRVHLYRKLTELTNQGPGEYIRNARLKMATELLKEKHLDISTVATETGFSSISVFSRAFKQLYGMSPSDYINKNN